MAGKTGIITNSIITYLNLRGWYVWRQNNGAVYDKGFNGYRAGSVKKGVPDIIGFNRKDGRFIGVEVKQGKDKPKPEQLQFAETLIESGGVSLIVYSTDDFLEQYNNVKQ